MSLPGFGMATAIRKYESYETLKKWIQSQVGHIYDQDYTYEVIKNGVTLTTGATPLEMLSIENGAVAFIGKTELTLVGACSDGDSDNNSLVVTLVYKDQDGTEFTATCTVTDDAENTEVAFLKSDGVTAVTDYYCSVSCTANQAIAAGDTFGYGATGALTAAAGGGVIAAEATSATQANMGGVGIIYGRSHTDHADADASVYHLDYMTPWGEIKRGATCTLTATSSDEIRFIESDAATYVKDFYRVISWVTTKTTTANGHEGLLTDSDCSNVNGAGGDVYGCINELTDSTVIMRMTAPHTNASCAMFLGKVIATSTLGGGATADSYCLSIKLTPYGDSKEKTLKYNFGGTLELDIPVKLKPDTNVNFYVHDLGAASEVSVTAWYILAKEMS